MRAPVPASGAADAAGGGLAYALLTYFIWGIVPVYFKLLGHVPAVEVVAQRVVWTIPFLAVILWWRHQWTDFAHGLRDPRIRRNLSLSALLIASNWLIFIWAVTNDHLLATSLGYYLNPLVNVVLGRLVLHERLSRTQWLAVLIAMAGVALLAVDALDTLWVSVMLASSFAVYGLVRKMTPIGSVPGLAMETTLLAPLALALAGWFILADDAPGFGSDLSTSLLLVAAGVVTATPLLLFATAARRLSYTVLGFCQYVSPSMTFLLGVFVYGEAMSMTKLASFAIIWFSIALFSADALLAYRRNRATASSDAPPSAAPMRAGPG